MGRRIKISLMIGALFFNALLACEGDCLACHPGLKKMKAKEAKEHAVLQRCKHCHKKPMSDHNGSMQTACGEDCWGCHDIRKVQSLDVAVHKGLNRCIQCHLKLDRSLLRPPKPSMFEQIYR